MEWLHFGLFLLVKGIKRLLTSNLGKFTKIAIVAIFYKGAFEHVYFFILLFLSCSLWQGISPFVDYVDFVFSFSLS
jgi:hypothetical protein